MQHVHDMTPSPILPARLSRDRVPAVYQWIAPIHDLLAVIVEQEARQRGLAWARIRNGEAILEVGVGTGLSFHAFLKANPDGWTEGIDRSAAMLRHAQRRAARTTNRNYRLRVGTAYALDYPAASFDLIWCSYMFDMLPVADFTPVLKEFRRVLRPGGRLVMVNETVGRRWYNRIWNQIYRVYPPLMGGCRGIRIEPFLQRAGFTRRRRFYVSQWTFPSEVVYGEKPT